MDSLITDLAIRELVPVLELDKVGVYYDTYLASLISEAKSLNEDGFLNYIDDITRYRERYDIRNMEGYVLISDEIGVAIKTAAILSYSIDRIKYGDDIDDVKIARVDARIHKEICDIDEDDDITGIIYTNIESEEDIYRFRYQMCNSNNNLVAIVIPKRLAECNAVKELIFDQRYIRYEMDELLDDEIESIFEYYNEGNNIELDDDITIEEIVRALRKYRGSEFREEDIFSLMSMACREAYLDVLEDGDEPDNYDDINALLAGVCVQRKHIEMVIPL